MILLNQESAHPAKSYLGSLPRGVRCSLLLTLKERLAPENGDRAVHGHYVAEPST